MAFECVYAPSMKIRIGERICWKGDENYRKYRIVESVWLEILKENLL